MREQLRLPEKQIEQIHILRGLAHSDEIEKSELRKKSDFFDVVQSYRVAAVVHRKKSKKWYTFVILGIVASIAVIVCFKEIQAHLMSVENVEPLKYSEWVIAATLTKLSILSFISGVIIWCARHLRIQKHLQTVNERRARSLDTLRVMLDMYSADSEGKALKEKILEATLQAIFQPIPTGYLLKEEQGTFTINLPKNN